MFCCDRSIFSIAYPNISNWIDDRNVKKEVYETVAFIKERKAEVTSGKYGMVQVLFKRQLEVFTMSPEDFLIIQSYQSSPFFHKQDLYLWFSDTGRFYNEQNQFKKILDLMLLDSNVHVYPSCITIPMRHAFV